MRRGTARGRSRPLPDRQIGAAVDFDAEWGLEPVRKGSEELGGPGMVGGVLDAAPVGQACHVAQADVVCGREPVAAEVLEHHADLR
ncbi:hypothetical protein ABN034_33080 [Actinopolymorpha sp. B11F2]|uniref:hypothetical protein n=1 Tax=Actinopolymorpha sp. B11F2 TaxID=3160862 RepID=UPI0032E4E89E